MQQAKGAQAEKQWQANHILLDDWEHKQVKNDTLIWGRELYNWQLKRCECASARAVYAS